MQKPKLYLIPLLLFIISFFIRLSLISKGPYHLDCLTLAMRASQTFETKELFYLHSHGFPLTAILGALFVGIAQLFSINDPVWAVNFMSVVFSSLCVVALYYLVQELFDTSAAAASALLFSVSPIFLGNSVYGNSHTPSLFFILWGLSTILIFQKSQNKYHLILSGALWGLAGAARLQELAIMFIPIGLLFFLRPNSENTKTSHLNTPVSSLQHLLICLTASTFIILLFYAPLLINKLSDPSTPGIISYLNYEIFDQFVGVSQTNLRLLFLYNLVNFSKLGLVLMIAGFFLVFNKSKKIFLFLFVWFITPLIACSTIDFSVPRHIIMSLLPIYIILGFLFSKFIKSSLPFKIVIILSFALIISANVAYIFPILKFRNQNSVTKDFAIWIGQHTEPNAIIIVGDENNFIKYYGKRAILNRPRKMNQRYSPDELEAFKEKLDSALNNNIPVYITSIGLFSHNPEHQFSNFMDTNYRLILRGRKYTQDWHEGVLYHTLLLEDIAQILLKE